MTISEWLAERRKQRARKAVARRYRRAIRNEYRAIEERLWAEAEMRDHTHGRDERARVLYRLAIRFSNPSNQDAGAKAWQVPVEWLNDVSA